MITREELNTKMQQAVSPEQLAKEKLTMYKNYIIERLDAVKELIEHNKFAELSQYISCSPSGDCYGRDNHYIDFSFNDENGIDDIAQASDYCRFLADIANGKIDPNSSFVFWRDFEG